MKKAAAVVLFLLLTGCATKPDSGSVKQVQSLAVKICRFLPAAQTVAEIFLSTNAMTASALSVAEAICNAVTTNPLADGPGAKNYKPHVNGVRVRGQFVQ